MCAQVTFYELAFRQFGISDTRVFDRPAAGRSFFEQLIRDHLDVGRLESVSLIFDRRINRRTPGIWRTKVITKGVDPQISCYYRSSRIKQYFKEHRASRTETVVCDIRDFGIGRRVTAENWKALRAVGENPTSVCATRKPPMPDPSGCGELHRGDPTIADRRSTRPRTAVRGPAGDGGAGRRRRIYPPARRVRQPCPVRAVTTPPGPPYTSRQATNDLRRLKRKGLIVSGPAIHRYQLTPLGRRVAVLFTKVYGRVLAPGLAESDPRLPTNLAHRSELAHAWRRLNKRLNDSQTQPSPQPEPQTWSDRELRPHQAKLASKKRDVQCHVSSLTQPVGPEKMQDQPLFDAITQDAAPEHSDTPLLLLDRTLRIRGCNSAYERVSRRRRDELIGQRGARRLSRERARCGARRQMSSRVCSRSILTRWTSNSSLFQAALDPMSRPSSVAAADQMGFTPDEARCPGLDVPRPPVVPFAAQAAVEFFRDRRPIDGRGVEDREFVGGVHPVRVRRGVAARGSKDSGGSAKPDG